MFLTKSPVCRPIGPLLSAAREDRGLSLAEASQRAGLHPAEASALEEDRPLDAGIARLQAVSYARSLGLELVAIKDSLPALPTLVSRKQTYISNIARPLRPRFRLSMELLAPLAPLGRAAVYALLIATLFSTWGMMKQLSRVRSIPWITSNNQLSTFPVR
jgi:transcriptional regulator with XRE-family HTH domain